MSENIGRSRAIGVIGKPHGNKGEVYVMMFTDYPKTIKKGCLLYLDKDCKREIRVRNLREIVSKGKLRTIIEFFDIDTRISVEKLRDCVLYRDFKDQPGLKNGIYWIDELAECKVYLSAGKMVGSVIEVEKLASNDNLIIKDKLKKIITVPMVEDYIEDIDIRNRKIILKKVPEYI